MLSTQAYKMLTANTAGGGMYLKSREVRYLAQMALTVCVQCLFLYNKLYV
ncbi:putative orphan protein [Pseudoalteromonas translucida]|uniref:Orphan protein n=1 Tax=Pseudoalteromonas translucida (strain TAC 125) TaxID=326442 RepID=Q3IGQ5_PSET1|nr:putative orphan protein [Pseudoalteromonas translucida]